MAGTEIQNTAAGDVPQPIHEQLSAELEHLAAEQGRMVRYNPDAPSEEWGWHGSWREFAPKGSRLLLWIGVAIMFIMLIGNHVSHVEDYYLVAIGLLMAIWLLRAEIKIRKERQRRP